MAKKTINKAEKPKTPNDNRKQFERMGFKSSKKYTQYLLRRRGFKSKKDYRTYLAKKKNFDSYTDYLESLVQKKGFTSLKAYFEYLAKQKGFKSLNAYKKNWLKEKGFKSGSDYKKDLAKRKGFDSVAKYNSHLNSERQKKLENQVIGDLIRMRLSELEKNQSWLSKKLDVSREIISKYAQGKHLPGDEILVRLFSVLKVPYQTLDDLVENYNS